MNQIFNCIFFLIVIDIIWSIYIRTQVKKLKLEKEYKEQKKIIKKKNFPMVCLVIFIVSLILFFIISVHLFVMLTYFIFGISPFLTEKPDMFFNYYFNLSILLFNLTIITGFIRNFYIKSKLNKIIK